MRSTFTPSAVASDWTIKRDARVRFAAPLLLRQPQALEAEARLGGLRKLLLEPLEIERDRGVDLRLGRTRTHDELGRKPVTHDDPVTVDALRPPYVQLDRAAAYVQKAHGCTVGVVSDDNIRDTTAHGSCCSSCQPPGPASQDA